MHWFLLWNNGIIQRKLIDYKGDFVTKSESDTYSSGGLRGELGGHGPGHETGHQKHNSAYHEV